MRIPAENSHHKHHFIFISYFYFFHPRLVIKLHTTLFISNYVEFALSSYNYTTTSYRAFKLFCASFMICVVADFEASYLANEFAGWQSTHNGTTLNT